MVKPLSERQKEAREGMQRLRQTKQTEKLAALPTFCVGCGRSKVIVENGHNPLRCWITITDRAKAMVCGIPVGVTLCRSCVASIGYLRPDASALDSLDVEGIIERVTKSLVIKSQAVTLSFTPDEVMVLRQLLQSGMDAVADTRGDEGARLRIVIRNLSRKVEGSLNGQTQS